MTTEQRISIFKWSVVLIAIIFLFLMFKRCGDGGKTKPTSDTISVRIDTVWMQSKSDTFYTPAVTKTEWKTKLEYKTDTLESFEYMKVDTTAILKDYLATRYYQDSIAVQYGKVYISDTITKNKIASRGIKTNFNIPVVRETITLRQPKRNIAYLGFSAMGSEQSFLEQTEVSFGVKVKNDKYYGVKGAMSRNGNILAGIEFKIPIRLNKKQ